MCQPSGEKGVVIAPLSLQLKPLSITTPSKPPARRKPTARRKPILRHPADLRSLGFMTLFYGCLLTLWWFDAKIVSWGVPGYLLFTLIYGVQLIYRCRLYTAVKPLYTCIAVYTLFAGPIDYL